MKTAATGFFIVFLLLAPVNGTDPVPSFVPSPAPIPVESPPPARGLFLIADQKMFDSRFKETVILITHFDPSGTVGVIINRPTETPLTRAFPDIEDFLFLSDVLYIGGPVFPDRVSMLIRSENRPESAEHVFADVYFDRQLDTLRSMIGGRTGAVVRVFAGYAGWSPGQLEREINHGWWRVSRGDPAVIFDREPSGIWPEMIRRSSGQWVKNG